MPRGKGNGRWLRAGWCALSGLLTAPAWGQYFEPLYAPAANAVSSGNRTIWAQSPTLPNSGLMTFSSATTGFVAPATDIDTVPAKFFATGGGSMVQPDETWAYGPTTGHHRFVYGAAPPQGAWSPSLGFDTYATQYVVGVGYGDDCHPYEVWITRTGPGSPFLARFDYCYMGGFFFSVPSSTNMTQVATGGGEVWALDTSGHVFRFDTTANQFVAMPGTLSQIAVGVDGVWGIDAFGAAFEFNPITQAWDALPSPHLEAIWAGGNGIFARECRPILSNKAAAEPRTTNVGNLPVACGERLIDRYEPATRRFVAITAGYQPTDMSIGSGAGALGINTLMNWIVLWVE